MLGGVENGLHYASAVIFIFKIQRDTTGPPGRSMGVIAGKTATIVTGTATERDTVIHKKEKTQHRLCCS